MRINMDESGMVRIRVLGRRYRATVTEDVGDAARRRCPVDEGDLRASITAYPEQGIVTVGTDHWYPTEFGSAPHIIRSTGSWSLHNAETGQHFGREVHHPGTPSQPFMRPALNQRRRLHL